MTEGRRVKGRVGSRGGGVGGRGRGGGVKLNACVADPKMQISPRTTAPIISEFTAALGEFGVRGEGHGQGRQETLTSPAAAHEAEVVEARHLVLHHARGVPQLGRVVLVVARHHRDHRPVGYVPQGHHLSEPPRGQDI